MSLKMLPKFWRLRMINLTGQTLSFDSSAIVTVKLTPWELVSGAVVYGTIIEDDFGFSGTDTILDNGEVETAVFDNSSNLYWGIHGTYLVQPDLDASVGSCKLYLEFSGTDGNWPSDSTDFVITDLIPVVTCPIDNSQVVRSRSVNFEI